MELQRVFVKGVMDLDSDERILENGMTREASNIYTANSEGSDVGAIENSLGNERLTTLGLTNAKTIGAYADTGNELVYWFVTSDNEDRVMEYNWQTKTVSTVLASSKPNSVLNFSKDYLITGVEKIYNEDIEKDLFTWTDDLNEPPMINIERAKTYGLDGFTLDDILLIKKPPKVPISSTLGISSNVFENNLEDKFLAFSYRYKYLDGEYSALGQFSEYNFEPSEFQLDYQTQENNGMINKFNQATLEFNTGGKQVTEIQLVFTEGESNNIYVIDNLNKEDLGYADDSIQSYLFINNQIFAVLPSDEMNRLFDNVPLKAKAMDLVGARLVYGNYVEGHDMIDSNGDKVKPNLNLTVQPKATVTYPLSLDVTNSQELTGTITSIPLKKDGRINFSFRINDTSSTDSFDADVTFILERDYTDVNEILDSESFRIIFEDVLTYDFLNTEKNNIPADSSINPAVYDVNGVYVSGSKPFDYQKTGTTTFVIIPPSIEYKIDTTPGDNTDNDDPAFFTLETITWNLDASATYTPEALFSSSSVFKDIKTNRSYEAGLNYYDGRGRMSTVIVGGDNTAYSPHSNITIQTGLNLEISHNPPSWAEYYTVAIKQNKGNYYNIFASQFYEEGIYTWVKLEGANKDKVKEGDTLIVKSDVVDVVEELIKVSVLDIAYQENTNLGNGNYMKIVVNSFNMDSSIAYKFRGTVYDRKRSSRANSHLYNFTLKSVEAGVVTNHAIEGGSRIEFNIIGRRKDGFATVRFTKVAQRSYVDFIAWFTAEISPLAANGYVLELDQYMVRNDERVGIRIYKEANGSITIRSEYEDTGTEGSRSKLDGYVDISLTGSTTVFETEPVDNNSAVFFETPGTYEIVNGNHQGNNQNQSTLLNTPAIIDMPYFNVFKFGNGLESIAYRDGFNKKSLVTDNRPNSTTIDGYKQVRRSSDLSYSETYNDNTSLNGLNEFNLSRANFKEDIDKKYGSIQKIHARDTDIVVFQEDKIHKVLFGKDLLMNADGTSNVTSIENVLGQHIAYQGEYGISTDPESFVFDGHHIYCSDGKRGATLRLGRNGINEISAHGIDNWTKKRFKESLKGNKFGGFDPYFDLYVLNLEDNAKTVTFSEKKNGWTSFHDFMPDWSIGMNNDFFSFKNGDLYVHHSEKVPRNNFYGVQYTSKVKFIFNESPQDDKIFKTISEQSNSVWSASVRTNYTNSTITKEEFHKRESRFYAYTRRNEDGDDYSGFSANGIGGAQNILSATELEFITVPNTVSVGDMIYAVVGGANIQVGEVLSTQGNVVTLTVPTTALLNVGDYVFAVKNSRVESGSVRGYFMEVELENDDTTMAELYAVKTEIVKSYV